MDNNNRVCTTKQRKDKAMSVKMYPEVYDAFTRINRIRGMSNNSALNMIITEYIRANKKILDEHADV